MRYKKPFTPEQRQNARAIHRSLSTSFNTWRRRFRPRNGSQRQLFRELRDTIEEFAAALNVSDDMIDIQRLDRLRKRATDLAVRYAAEHFRGLE
jgi:hypothetical protein